MSNELSFLFSPIRINSMELKNRAVMPPMGTAYGAKDGRVTDRLVHYLARRASGGTGLIIVECCAVDPRGKGFVNEIGLWQDDLTPSLARIPEAIHYEGGKVALQIHHAGRESSKEIMGQSPEAPSPIPSVILGQPCEEMSRERIYKIIQAFASAAGRAQEAGFDAVEIHGAHGYLICQFLSPFSNQRKDDYGGSDENRARFALEIVHEVRLKVGPDFPILIRLSAEELVRGGYDIEFIKWLAPQLVEAGVDAIHVSVGVYSTPGNLIIASMDTEPGFNLFRVRAVKEKVDVPIIGVGRINDPRMADEAIGRGDADLISFGRQHMTDPDFIGKAYTGNFEDIRWCLNCNQGCINRLMNDSLLTTCTINPECGREFEGEPVKAENPKQVWVIGAGPAGLSAALAAARRGHHVKVFEKENEAGGQIKPASRPPHKEAYKDWVAWAVSQIKKLGISLTLSCEVTGEMIRSERPEAVILASGSIPIIPDIPGLDRDNVVESQDLLMGRTEPQGPAVILGGGLVGMETADFLINKGIKVTVLELLDKSPIGREDAHGWWLHRRLKKSDSRLILGARVTRVDQGAVLFEQGGQEQRLKPASLVVIALGAYPVNSLAEIIEELGLVYHVVGDAKKPRDLLEAVHEGHEAGLSI